MKNILATILAFVYISTSMGATIHLHYCMGKLASWDLIDHERDTCAQCGMIVKKTPEEVAGSKKKCCKDEHKLLKTGTDQKLSASMIYKVNYFSQTMAIHEPSMEGIHVFYFPVAHPNTHAPPLFDHLSRFIFYSNFRI